MEQPQFRVVTQPYRLNLEQLNRSTACINRVTVCEQRLATKRDHPAGRPVAQQPADR
jgi:hypothetical protein